jgi:hypothetical protein
MYTFALIYWSIILVIGIFLTFKAFNGINKLVISLFRKSIITRFALALPLRLVMNMIFSFFAGVLIFFHVLFFAVMAVFIFVLLGYKDSNKNLSDILAWVCISSMFIPVVISFFNTISEEIIDFKQKKSI